MALPRSLASSPLKYKKRNSDRKSGLPFGGLGYEARTHIQQVTVDLIACQPFGPRLQARP